MLSQLKYGREEFLLEYEMFEGDLYQNKFHQIRKQLSYLANLNADNFKEIHKRFIKQIVEIGWKEFQSFSFNIDEQNNYLVYQKFRNFINQETNNMTLQKYEQQFKQYENELKDYFEELMKPYDQKFEASRQNCLRDILNNVKKQKIKFL